MRRPRALRVARGARGVPLARPNDRRRTHRAARGRDRRDRRVARGRLQAPRRTRPDGRRLSGGARRLRRWVARVRRLHRGAVACLGGRLAHAARLQTRRDPARGRRRRREGQADDPGDRPRRPPDVLRAHGARRGFGPRGDDDAVRARRRRVGAERHEAIHHRRRRIACVRGLRDQGSVAAIEGRLGVPRDEGRPRGGVRAQGGQDGDPRVADPRGDPDRRRGSRPTG